MREREDQGMTEVEKERRERDEGRWRRVRVGGQGMG
jgi:hypothetical protein